MAELNFNMSNLMSKMNYNLKMRETTRKSLLPEIETELIKAYYKMGERTSDMDIVFNSHLITNPNVFDEPDMYHGLELVGNLSENLIKQVENIDVVNTMTK